MARPKSLSRQLRSARVDRKLSVAELADQLGVSTASIYFWESAAYGLATPTSRRCARYSSCRSGLRANWKALSQASKARGFAPSTPTKGGALRTLDLS